MEKVTPPKYHHLIIPTYRTYTTLYERPTGVNILQHSDAGALCVTKVILSR